MITFKEALQKVLEHPLNLGSEHVLLMDSMGRYLDEPIYADRNFPPFDRVTKDGIAIQFDAVIGKVETLRIENIASAGMAQCTLQDETACIEVMTGAVLPKHTDTVIMYEHLTIENNRVTINETVTKGQNIHYEGSDESKGTQILSKGTKITPAEIGVMASVGKSNVLVKKVPRVCSIATGNELVDVDVLPEPHQIRKSNSFTMVSALSDLRIEGSSLHLLDDKKSIEDGLSSALRENDVLLLSGGVSKGKFDFIPEVMETLGVEQLFHRVAQRPGKPFWFGIHKEFNTVIFSFPGNPVSTFANYHLYFLPWLFRSWGIKIENQYAQLTVELDIKPPLTRFIQVRTHWLDSCLQVTPVVENGSGDLTSLSRADGFICLEPRDLKYTKGELVSFISTR
ncbi:MULTISPECIES: molybdopterin molybdotransferase MoeA [Maribacter]|uniref:Molybdopterin molybdenumtransferase n=1 Tax=Maribacter flavus TaxID=1658664 RepID=A0ABU7IMA8_9FLAO|nr:MULTISPECIES: molybdopterin molybdotransferase MoeA [Maribacter]MDC6406978.1 molybdopterin molybdotransferase MoeA [Maribacter sp. PR66]MEE1974093.1 molybdopterin molybdotransferase MoeA [Maribacter flavus]